MTKTLDAKEATAYLEKPINKSVQVLMKSLET